MTQASRYLTNNLKLQELQVRLSKNAYLSKEPLPGLSDALIFQALKTAEKIPCRKDYFNFYHWFITMSQFAAKQVTSWKNHLREDVQDPLIIECQNIIKNSKSMPLSQKQTQIDYLMSIFIKDTTEKKLSLICNSLQKIKLNGKRLNYEIRKDNEEQINNKKTRELRIAFCLDKAKCQKLKETILKYPQVQNIQIKRRLKQKKIPKAE